MIDPSVETKTKKIPPKRKERFINFIAGLKETESLAALKELHDEGYDPIELFQCCMEGVRRVGLRFEEGRYFISALIMAGEIMRQSSLFLNPYLTANKKGPAIGNVLIGTIEGDIHDLGKNIVKELLECNGFEVTDLGVDVPVTAFADKALEINPDVVAISCLLTSCLANLREAVTLLHKPSDRSYTTIVGGCCIDQQTNTFIRADHWFSDAIAGVNFCKQTVLDKQM